MRINAIKYASNAINFGNALSTKQKKQERKIQQEISELEGEGLRIVKFYAPQLPSDPQRDTGIGYMDSKEASQFYNFAVSEFGANTIKCMPIGELTDLSGFNKDNRRPGAYDRSGLSVGADFIDIPKLATKEFGEILPKEIVQRVVQEHSDARYSSENRIDFTTTLGYQNQESYSINDEIGIAYNNFLYMPHPSRELRALRKEFEEFKNDPLYDEIDTRTALYPLLKDWGSGKIERIYKKDAKNNIIYDEDNNPVVLYEGNLFEGFDEHPSQKQKEVYDYLKNVQFKKAIDFYKFKQFLAYKCIDAGVDLAHQAGAQMFVDANIGWSWPEQQVFPDAFKKTPEGGPAEIGWGKTALKYEDLLEKDNSPAHKLLRMKFEHLLRHFDGVRVDVGWQYIHPSYSNCDFDWSDGTKGRPQPCDKIIRFVEQVARETKGPNFDQGNIIWECEANGADFNLEDGRIVDILNNIGGRGIFSTENEHQKDYNGWASVAYLKQRGINIDKCVVQTNNHDGEGVVNCANNSVKSSEQVGGVMRSLNIPSDQWWRVKDDNDHNAHVQKYSTGRFAECDIAKNKAILINDLLGRTDKIDYHAKDFNKDYKTRLERNYIENYYRTIPYGAGYVYGDVKALRADFDGSKQGKLAQLYNEAEKFAAYKRRDDGIYTEEAANNSEYEDIYIADCDIDALRNKHVDLIG